MQIHRFFANAVSYTVIAGLLALNLHVPAARAALIGTETVVQAAHAQQAHERVHSLSDREEVKAKLVSLGVDPAQVQARVDALTDEEIGRLAKHMDDLPAGGDAVFILVVIILLLGIFR